MIESFDLNTKLLLLPLQLIETKDGVILRRGYTRLKIAGEGVAQVIRLLIAAISEEAVTPLEICALLPPALHTSVQDLIRTLVSKHLLVPVSNAKCEIARDESALDVFYWNFGSNSFDVSRKLKNTRVVIVGVNYISRQLTGSLAASGFENYEVIDVPILRNLTLFETAGSLIAGEWPGHLIAPISNTEWLKDNESSRIDCVAVCSDFASVEPLREWNKICIAHKWPLVPIVLDGPVGNIGPFIMPGETACYECLYSRENSNLGSWSTERNIDSVSLEGQEVIGLLPTMATVLADFAAFELLKLFSGVLPVQNIGKLIEVNLLASQLISRKVLKIPRCIACSPLLTKTSSNARRAELAETANPGSK